MLTMEQRQWLRLAASLDWLYDVEYMYPLQQAINKLQAKRSRAAVIYACSGQDQVSTRKGQSIMNSNSLCRVSIPVTAGDTVTGLLEMAGLLLLLPSGLLLAASIAAAESGAERGAKDTAAADVTAEYKACTAQRSLLWTTLN